MNSPVTVPHRSEQPCQKQFDPKLNIHAGFSHALDPNYDTVNNAKISFPIEGEEDDVFFIENLLTVKECEGLISAANTAGFFDVEGFDKSIRNNARRRTIDSDLSRIMLKRLTPFIPLKTVEIDGCRWDLCRFLDHWRYLKYKNSQLFRPHYDGSKKIMNEDKQIYEMTVYTLNIYLNDGFQGGGTRFYMKCAENAEPYNDEQAGPVTHVVSPKQASALIFNHCNKGYLHDGEALNVDRTEVKEKYLLRADLIYRLREEDIPKLKQKVADNSCKFWRHQNAQEGIVEDFIGTQWKCACVGKNYI